MSEEKILVTIDEMREIKSATKKERITRAPVFNWSRISLNEFDNAKDAVTFFILEQLKTMDEDKYLELNQGFST